ncbi:MAG TPA: CotH kinase family protein, partial [Chthoniobacteraceae bacterium]|nr:CotH kinase family protein [Chthoniobacteraceae bacterium]
MCFPPRRFLPLLALLCALLAAPAAQAQVYISEFLADNQINARLDEDGDHSDWIEIWNSSGSPVSLNGWYLTDDAGDLRKWQFPVTTPALTVAAGARLLVYASAKDRKLAIAKLHTNFRLDKGGEYLGLVRPDGLTVEHAYGPVYPVQVQDIAYGLAAQVNWQPLLPEGAAGKAKVPLSAADLAAGWNSNPGFDDTTWQQGQSGFGYDTMNTYGALIGPGGDLQAAMHNVNSNALIRFVFNVSNVSSITALRLQMKYDDGYICYLNGTLLAQSFSPGAPSWNGQATADRNGAFTATYEVAGTAANASSFLVNGQNVLAFQMLNFTNGSTQDVDNQGAANGSRALCLPMLEANISTGPGTAGYLSTATPGATNSTTLTSLGPIISDTTNNVPRPTGDATSAPIVVTAKVLPSLKPLGPTNPVNLRYRVMYGGEVAVVMKDDGMAPDALAGDNFYTAQIPTANVGAGKMIRWKVEARDNSGTPSTSPPFRDQTDNEQYFGTVTEDNITTSQLPILHWFVENPGLSQQEGGTFCSIFFKPIGGTSYRFYDHIAVNLHGQSSAGFPVAKKSHDLNFNEDNRFEWKAGEKEQRAVNLITNYADKSKVRHPLMWESWVTTKHPASHWVQPVRVQQNGVFWGVYDLIENGDEDFLDRAGLDPDGALYKMYNSLENANAGAVEKKTREGETNHNDLLALVNGVDPARGITARRQYTYDNVDVPALINYMATNVVLLNHDFGHKNYYMYRDTNGTGEWIVLPWDQDLSLGHTWTSSQNYFNDDINSQAGLIVGGSGNRLMNLIAS